MRSVLVHREQLPPRGAPRGIVIALHAEGGDGSELLAPCAAAAPGWVVLAPQAARSRNAIAGGGSAWPGYAGYAWYRHDGAAIDPLSLADAMRQLALFVDDARRRHGAALPVVIASAIPGLPLAQPLARLLGHAVDGIAPIARGGDAELRSVVDRIERALAQRGARHEARALAD